MIRIGAFALSILALATASSAALAGATYKTLHSFSGASDGTYPQSGLVMDAAGNLYGTTPQGGAYDMGTLFKVMPDGTFTLLHTFKGGRDGAVPTGAALTLDGHGTIYGLTEQGGIANGGTAYRFRNGKMKVLHSFGVGDDSSWPQSGLLLQPDGSLVGTASQGGGAGGAYCAASRGCGTIFRLAPDGTETILHAFAGDAYNDGSGPTGTPVRDLAGNLYGTTYYGGQGDAGTVYRIAPDNTARILYVFTNPAVHPHQGLAIDREGNLFGTTEETSGHYATEVFEVDNKNQESIVYDLSAGTGNGVGLTSLLADRKGNLYGTLASGGGNRTGACEQYGGCGAFFVLDPWSHQVTVLHGFGGSDGQLPYSGVVTDGRGNFYGTTKWGGLTKWNNGYSTNGTLFKISMGTK